MREQYQSACISVNKYFCFTVPSTGHSLTGMEKYGQRVQLARKHAKLTQGQLCEKLDGKLSQQGISYLEAGEAYGSEFTAQIAYICEVDPLWLATGDGKMLDIADVLKAKQLMQKMSEYDKQTWLRMGNTFTEPKEGTNGKQ